MSKKQLPALCHAKDTGWFFSMVPDPASKTGRRRIYWSKDKAEANRLYREGIVKLVANAVEREKENVTLADAALWSLTDLADNLYNHKAASGRSASFLGQIKRYLTPFLRWLNGHGFNPTKLGLSQLTPALLSGYWRSLADNDKIGRREANHYVEQVRMLLCWGSEVHGLKRPPLGAITPFDSKAKKGHGRKQDKTPLSPDSIGRLLSKAGPTERAILMLALNCGFGAMDLATMKLNDVDLKTGKLSNNRQKTGAPRDFVLWPETVKALKAYLVKRTDSKGRVIYAHRGNHPRTPETAELFFIGHKGMPLVWERMEGDKIKRVDSVKLRFDRLCAKAGIELPYGSGFYSLRHTYSTMIGLATKDTREHQAAMGHLTVQMQETYRHDRKEKAQAAQKKLRHVLIKQIPTAFQNQRSQPRA